MRGHLRERSPGHWAIVIDVRDPQTGKRKRRWHSFEGTKRQAQVECVNCHLGLDFETGRGRGKRLHVPAGQRPKAREHVADSHSE